MLHHKFHCPYHLRNYRQSNLAYYHIIQLLTRFPSFPSFLAPNSSSDFLGPFNDIDERTLISNWTLAKEHKHSTHHHHHRVHWNIRPRTYNRRRPLHIAAHSSDNHCTANCTEREWIGSRTGCCPTETKGWIKIRFSRWVGHFPIVLNTHTQTPKHESAANDKWMGGAFIHNCRSRFM